MSIRHRAWIVLLLAVLGAGARLQAQEAAEIASEAEMITAPVEFDGTVLLRVRGVTSFPADQRARGIRDRLTAVAADPGIAVDAIRMVDGEGATRIVAGSTTIMTVFEADAALEQIQRAELAAAHLGRLQQAVVDFREARTAAALRRDALEALVATLVFALALGALWWFWRWLDAFLARRLQARIQSVEIGRVELLRAERIWAAVRGTLLAVRTIVYLAVALVYLGSVLSLFPWTRGLSRDMVAFALGPLQVLGTGFVQNIPSVVFLTVLFLLTRLVLRLTRLVFDGIERGTVALPDFDREWAHPTYNLVRVAIVAFALVVAYPYIPGSDSAAFRGVTVFMGIVFSLGSSSAISNVIAGYMLTYRRAFKVGDRIKVGGSMGEVIETRLQVTHLRSPKNEELIIPNSQILSSEVLNYSSLARNRGLILHTEVGIGYETPWRQVEAMLLEAASRTEGLASDPRPFVLVRRLGDFAVTYELNAYCSNVAAMLQLYAAMHRSILDVFNEYGVQIMTPAYEGDPAEPKVVPPKDWYAAPAAPPAATAVAPQPAAVSAAPDRSRAS